MSSAEIRIPGNRGTDQGIWVWLVPLMMGLLLVFLSRFGFLLFHTLAELFAIFVAVCLAVVMWQTYTFTRNHFLMYLGCGYFWVGCLDLVHALAYKDMNIFAAGGANLSVQFWVVTRYLEAFILLTAPFFFRRQLWRIETFVIFGAVAVLILWLVFAGTLPPMFVEGKGLTPFKVTSEYVIIGILLLAMGHLWLQRQHIDRGILQLMLFAIALTIAAEMAFTFYVSVFGFSNLVGHLFKLFSYWLIFIAMIHTTLREPFRALTRELSTYDAVPEPIVVTDRDGNLLQLNRAAIETVGQPLETLEQQHCHELFHAPDVPVNECGICRYIRESRPLSAIEIQVGNGRWHEISLSPVGGRDAPGGMVQVIRDISEKKRNQLAVHEVEGRIRLLLDSTGEGIYGIDTEGHCTVINAAGVRMLGYDSDEPLLGKSMHELIHHSRPDGSPYPASECPIYQAWRNGVSCEVDDEVMWHRDGSSFPVSYRSYPVRQDGKILGAVCIFTDNSERVREQREKQQLQAQLLHSQKLEAIGQLTGGIAHDFNNILACVLGFSSLALGRVKEIGDEKLVSYLEQILSSGEKARELIAQMLVFSRRKSESSEEAVILQPLVKEVVKMLQATLPASIHIDLKMPAEDLRVQVDPVQFHQVLMNLCINARDAMAGKGRLGIILRPSAVHESIVCVSCHEPFDTSGVELVVTDSGEGMPANLRDRIFDPFFTTKEVGRGTGMGLSVVHGIVHQHGGHIGLRSLPGEGSEFHIWWPAAASGDGEGRQDAAPHEVGFDTGSGHVLVVEDEHAVAAFLEELLGTAGFSVSVVESAEEAMKACENHCDEYDLVLTDQTMPGMSGVELAQRIHASRPGMPVVLMSGYSLDIDDETIRGADLYASLQKPVESGALIRVIKEAIASVK